MIIEGRVCFFSLSLFIIFQLHLHLTFKLSIYTCRKTNLMYTFTRNKQNTQKNCNCTLAGSLSLIWNHMFMCWFKSVNKIEHKCVDNFKLDWIRWIYHSELRTFVQIEGTGENVLSIYLSINPEVCLRICTKSVNDQYL